VRVEIWSDVVCPWCYIGKRRFDEAMAQFDHADAVEVVWRSYELDPAGPREREGDYVSRLAVKYGVSEDNAQAMIDRMVDVAEGVGIEMRFDRARLGNTFDAHRLLHLARDRGVQGEVKERLFQAAMTEGRPIGDRDELVALAADAGLDPEEAAAVLAGDEYAENVRADEREAAALGCRGVPFFVVDRRFAVAGAQSTDLFLEVLDEAWAGFSTTPGVVEKA
jgi:predicted DsbA family dithiol-disulfide isomerase